jgi:hypothetical protein
MSSLGPDARALLEATSDGDDPSELDAARVRAKIEQRLLLSAAGVAAATSGAAAAHASGASLPTAVAGSSLPGVAGSAAVPGAAGGAALAGATYGSTAVTAGKVLLAVALAGGAVGTGVEIERAWRAPEPSVAAARRSNSEAAVANAKPRASDDPAAHGRKEAVALEKGRVGMPAATSTAPLPTTRSGASVEQRQRPAIAPRPSAQPAAKPSTSSTPPTKDSILAEAALLRAARSALAQSDAASALRSLDEHAARFPRAALQEEAAAARVLALCAAGRAGEARAAAAHFLAQRASSPLAPQVRQACASQSGTVGGTERGPGE